ncbi:hydrogenase maturation protease [Streptomyces sp. JJ38]|uniref:hydrogenase maturation protease n=1 Tax=Streptomyces sp. JJ38 TaxID=2738128 RepID=UPI001C587A8B|nr:hydrogenase maturation protease [Streptomyces sp. JJ38]
MSADTSTPWEAPEPTGERAVTVDGVRLAPGSRVSLAPLRHGDVLDLALAGRTAEVVSVEEDFEGQVHVAVVLEDDPGRDFGPAAQIGHRFFFTPEELRPAPPGDTPRRTGRVLVAGIGNIFMADDGFGPAVAEELRGVELPPEVHVADFGIRGMDLAYRLTEGYTTAVLVDAAPRGEAPGTLAVVEPPLDDFDDAMPEGHAMDPVKVLALARRLTGDRPLPRVLVVGCEPLVRMTGEEPDVSVGLSPPVRDAVTAAVPLITSLVAELLARPEQGGAAAGPGGADPGGAAAGVGEEVSP